MAIQQIYRVTTGLNIASMLQYWNILQSTYVWYSFEARGTIALNSNLHACHSNDQHAGLLLSRDYQGI